MKWIKQGLIHVPNENRWWAKTHAFNPTPEILDDNTIRVYFASLDDSLYGRIGYVDLDAGNPTRIKRVARDPVLDIGERGTFDDSGVNPSCAINLRGRKHLYYIGWQRCERVPYMLFTGLAILHSDEAFRKHSRIPVLDRTPSEPFSRSALFVLADGPGLRGWYWTCERWSEEQGRVHYNNVIKLARSTDGIHWTSENQTCIAPDRPGDYSVGRPWVIKSGTLYQMWYAIRSHGPINYRIGYAESDDGVNWTRMDHLAGIDVSANGWDSEMICSPSVIDAKGKRYMFYNGNQNGRTGFGWAVLDSD